LQGSTGITPRPRSGAGGQENWEAAMRELYREDPSIPTEVLMDTTGMDKLTVGRKSSRRSRD